MDQPVLTLRGRIGERPLVFSLPEGVHDIGRSSSCSVRLDEPSVSRLHARLHIEGQKFRLEDLGSSNGTRLNGRELTGPVELVRGDRLTFGNIGLNVDDGTRETEMFLDQTQIRAGLSISLDEARATRAGESSKKAYLFRILAEAGELMTSRREPEEMFEPLLELVSRALQPERIFLLLRDEQGAPAGPAGDETIATGAGKPGPPRIVASRGPKTGKRLAGESDNMILSQTLLDRVLTERTAFLTEDASQDQRLLGGHSIISSGTRSAMAAPLFDNERVIGVLYADTRDPTIRYDRDELKAFVLLANVVAVAITHARYHELEKERQRLRTELFAARRIMSRLLPAKLPDVPGLRLAAHLEPCEEVAGDLYDARLLPDGRILLVVGDVSGKGLPAALLVAALLPAIRLGAEGCLDVGHLVERVNEQLFASTEALRFATLFLGLLEPRSGRLEYVNAGHNPPLLVLPDGGLEPLTAVGPPVGMVPAMSYPARSCQLEPGQRLFFYSDGLTEAMNGEQDMYGDERLHSLLIACAACSLDELHRRVLEDVLAFTDGTRLGDDLTLLLVERDRDPA
jgi:phosphoserine phosphatase RsbU/P